jgi:anti-sigma factor RsiW
VFKDLATRHTGDRRMVVSRSFKRRLVARLAVAGLVVFAAVCVAYGAVGVGVGAVILVGAAVFVRIERRRRHSTPGRLPHGPDPFPR